MAPWPVLPPARKHGRGAFPRANEEAGERQAKKRCTTGTSSWPFASFVQVPCWPHLLTYAASVTIRLHYRSTHGHGSDTADMTSQALPTSARDMVAVTKQGSEVIKSRVVPAVYADSSQRCWEHTDITGGCARCRQMKRSWAKLRPFNGTRIKEL